MPGARFMILCTETPTSCQALYCMFRRPQWIRLSHFSCSLHLMDEFPLLFSYSFFHHCAVLNSSYSASSIKKNLIYKRVEIVDQKCWLWVCFFYSVLIIISMDSFPLDLKYGWKIIFWIHRSLKKKSLIWGWISKKKLVENYVWKTNLWLGLEIGSWRQGKLMVSNCEQKWKSDSKVWVIVLQSNEVAAWGKSCIFLSILCILS